MGYPNAAERRRLERFPDRIPVEDLRACFALSDRDRLRESPIFCVSAW